MDRAYRRVLTIVGSGFLGVLIAAILQILYIQGIVVDEFVGAGVGIAEVMAIVVVIFLLIGVILSAVE